jgi:hypothetical protein
MMGTAGAKVNAGVGYRGLAARRAERGGLEEKMDKGSNPGKGKLPARPTGPGGAPRPPMPGKPPAKAAPKAGAKPPAAAGQLAQTAGLLSAVLGAAAEETRSVQAVFKALGQPGKQVILELPWYPDGGTHQLVLRAREGDRVTFYNPLGHQGGPGTELTDGLRRRVEPDGTESAALADVEALFRGGKARALIATLG